MWLPVAAMGGVALNLAAERIAAIRAAGANAFTIGTAAIDASYAPGAGPLETQLRAVTEDCRAAG